MSKTTGPQKKGRIKDKIGAKPDALIKGKTAAFYGGEILKSGKPLTYAGIIDPAAPLTTTDSPHPLLEIDAPKILAQVSPFSESKAREKREAKAFDKMVLWVRQNHGENPKELRKLLEDPSENITLRTAAGLVLTQVVQEQATKISRKTRAFGHHASTT